MTSKETKHQTARKGDLVVVEQRTSTYFTGRGTVFATEFNVGVVASATREGTVKTWRHLGYGEDLLSTGAQPIRYDKCYVLPKSRIDVDAALVAAKLHCWPGHPTQPKAFDSIEDVRECLRPLLLAD